MFKQFAKLLAAGVRETARANLKHFRSSSPRKPGLEREIVVHVLAFYHPRRVPRPDAKKFAATRDETAALTAQLDPLEHEIDQRVAALYGL